MKTTFARCDVTLELVKPADGMIAIDLFRGALLRPAQEDWPWFCLRTDIRIGLGATVITDAECVEPGAQGNLPAAALVEVAGYPRDALRVASTSATGGVGRSDVYTEQEPGIPMVLPVGLSTNHERDWHELADMAALVRMNIDRWDDLLSWASGDHQAVAYAASDADYIERVLIHGDIYSTVARVLLGRKGVPMIAMGFHKTRLVYLSTGKELLNALPGGGRLFLPSDGVRLLGS